MRILSLLAINQDGWKHPWRVTVRWDRLTERWRAMVRPGLVNSKDASIRLPVADIPRDTLARYERAKVELPESVDCWLSERPRMPLSAWRPVGRDAAMTSTATDADGNVKLNYESVPDFFIARGVAPAPDTSFDAAGMKTTINGLRSMTYGSRLLRACELVLVIDRPATRSQWSTGTGLDGTFAQFDLVNFQKSNARDRAYIEQRNNWRELERKDAIDFIVGSQDLPYDEYHLATVWMMSQHGAPLESEPDHTWVPFVEQRDAFFWNFNHCVERLDAPLAPLILELRTGLAGGVADALNALILAQVNDGNSAAAQLVKRDVVKSHLWTV